MPPKASPDGQHLFSQLRFYFLTKAHMHLMMKRVVEQGGALDDSFVPGSTTHVICPPKTSRAVLDAALSTHHADASSSSYELVTQQFVAQSIIKGKRQNEADFRPVIIEPVASPPKPAVTPSRPVKKQKLEESGVEELEDKVNKVPTPSTLVPRRSSATGEETKEVEQEQKEDDEKAKLPCIVRRQGADWVAVQGRKPRYTGGNTGIPWGSYGVWDEPFNVEKARQTVEKLRQHWYVVASGGGGGGGSKSKNGNGGTSSETAATRENINEEEEEDIANKKGTLNSTSTSTLNGVCSHVACSKRHACLSQLLEEFKNKVYLPGRDQFKIKAIDKAKQMLIMYPKPLNGDEDVDKVGLGAKSSEKVKELLRSGQMERTAATGKDEMHTAHTEFMKVWGVGPSVASKWYSLGCRTLQDVEKKVEEKVLKLSEQQKCGLKYFDEFEVKIPRDEVAKAESIVREATFELVEHLGARNPEKTYCFATGSYRRGKAESSDIDILIVLPENMPVQDCHEFLQQLLVKLIDQKGLLVDEMGPREVWNNHRRSGGGGGGGGSGDGDGVLSTHASWMGVCRVPGHSIHRRIDFKMYSNQHGATAVNYFANSQAFCRATRHWANTSATALEAAQKLNPIATGIKISDLVVCPMIKRRINGSNETVPLEPAVQLTCETELYDLIGLEYVPVTMRYFHDYF
jgi:hypothetical protein